MTFDTRAHRAAQGIRRAVEVMEMSDTKAPPKVERFDRYRDRKARNQRIVAVVVGVAVPLVLVVGAVSVWGSDPEPAVTEPSTSATPTLTGGTERFEPAFTYLQPAGWEKSEESAREFFLRPIGGADEWTGIYMFRDVVASSPGCSGQPEPGVGRSSLMMTGWLSGHPALISSRTEPVDIGGLTGYRVDITMSDGWDQTCPDLPGVPYLSLFTDGTARPSSRLGIAEGERMRVYVLDAPIGGTVTIMVEVGDAARFDDVLKETAPFVDSIAFGA